MRCLVAILVGMPLLMPPGMCICQFLPSTAVNSDAREFGTLQETSPSFDEKLGCSCCKHRVERAANSDNSRCQPRAANAKSMLPVPHEHVPGCPVLRSGDQSKVAQSQRLQWEGRTSLIEMREMPRFEPEHTSRAAADCRAIGTTPIYLTYRTLLI